MPISPVRNDIGKGAAIMRSLDTLVGGLPVFSPLVSPLYCTQPPMTYRFVTVTIGDDTVFDYFTHWEDS